MSGALVGLVYAAAVLVALLLLYLVHAKWYWHVLSVAVALIIGLVPMPAEWKTPLFDLTIGFLFILLMIWGIGAPFIHHRHA